jgi:hypothetical protein
MFRKKNKNKKIKRIGRKKIRASLISEFPNEVDLLRDITSIFF